MVEGEVFSALLCCFVFIFLPRCTFPMRQGVIDVSATAPADKGPPGAYSLACMGPSLGHYEYLQKITIKDGIIPPQYPVVVLVVPVVPVSGSSYANCCARVTTVGE